jgi:hypothetical protein
MRCGEFGFRPIIPINMNRELCDAPVSSLFDAGNSADQPGLLLIGAFPLLESICPAGNGDKEKARLIVSLLQLGLKQDSDL